MTMGTNELKKTIDDLEREVIEELQQESSQEENPNKMFNVIFPYQVRLLIHDNDDDHPPTEVVINTHSQEYYSGRDEQDVRFQKQQSDKYSKERQIAYITKYVRDEMWSVDGEDCHISYTGNPEIREMSEEELHSFTLGTKDL